MSVEVASNAVASQHESISSVSKPYLGDLRLPAYRVTHLGRYHPYGRKVAYHATSQPVDLMVCMVLRLFMINHLFVDNILLVSKPKITGLLTMLADPVCH